MKHTTDQQRAIELLAGPAKHILLYGGSRSGKTALLVEQVISRAMRADKSRHAVFRYRFSHAKQSLALETFPEIWNILGGGYDLNSCLDKSDWYYKLPNGSEIWIGGLDDKERTEKILGKEYATIYFNECSQIQYASVLKARTRLAQKTELSNKFYYDENPPTRGHWTYKEFISHTRPGTKEKLPNPDDFVSLRLNPEGNRQNISADYIAILEAMPEAERARFLRGEWGEAVSGAVYGKEITIAYEDKRVCEVPYDAEVPVDVWFDLGIDDAMALIFSQNVGREVRIIDAFENTDQGINFYIEYIKSKRYVIGTIHLPHDGGHRQLATGKGIDAIFKQHFDSVRVHNRTTDLMADMYHTNLFLRRCWFDEENCMSLLESLEAYRREYDEDKGVYKKPIHDWSSHFADAMRLLACFHKETTNPAARKSYERSGAPRQKAKIDSIFG